MTQQHRDLIRDQLFVARMSKRYHLSRQRFFNRWSQRIKFVSAFSATAVFFSIQSLATTYMGVSAADVAKWSGMLLGVLQFFDFFAGLESKAMRHEAFAKDYTNLEQSCVAVLCEESVSSQDARRVSEIRYSIESAEGPTLYWLSVRAYNEQVLEQTSDVSAPEIVKIPFYQKPVLQIWDIAPHGV
ncbi:hypothetical protein [Aliiroseovarius crassostreae]|uniref:hypothetical protein n=1 Tax=Aliiroseovarius crassostreae TaxID=154981 RepID=UPI0021FE8950|nr:hypothetical protein [Aliiroseovarius crassostreae]UWQ08272.1 hypothetical protein K3X25_01320 [Aliiroseovarius crassostreae]